MWGKFGLGAINGLHKTGVSPQAGHPHWYATQVSCFWTHSIHCHFDSNYNCNLGLLNDLWTMLNERTVISLLWWEESLGTDFPPPPNMWQVLFQHEYLFPILSSFSFMSPHFFPQNKYPCWDHWNPTWKSLRDFRLRSHSSETQSAQSHWRWNDWPTSVLFPPKETHQSLFLPHPPLPSIRL